VAAQGRININLDLVDEIEAAYEAELGGPVSTERTAVVTPVFPSITAAASNLSTFCLLGQVEAKSLREVEKECLRIKRSKEAPLQASLGSTATASDFYDEEIRRLMRRAAVLCESKEAIKEVDSIIKKLVGKLLTVADDLVKRRVARGGPRLICVDDIIWTNSQTLRLTLLGFGGSGGLRHVFSTCSQKVLKQVHPSLSICPVSMSIIEDCLTCVLEKVLLCAAGLAISDKTREPLLRAEMFSLTRVDGVFPLHALYVQRHLLGQ
jgi:hypothetical protein